MKARHPEPTPRVPSRRLPRATRGETLAAAPRTLLRPSPSSPPSATPPGEAWPAGRRRGFFPSISFWLARDSGDERSAGLTWGSAARRRVSRRCRVAPWWWSASCEVVAALVLPGGRGCRRIWIGSIWILASDSVGRRGVRLVVTGNVGLLVLASGDLQRGLLDPPFRWVEHHGSSIFARFWIVACRRIRSRRRIGGIGWGPEETLVG